MSRRSSIAVDPSDDRTSTNVPIGANSAASSGTNNASSSGTNNASSSGTNNAPSSASNCVPSSVYSRSPGIGSGSDRVPSGSEYFRSPGFASTGFAGAIPPTLDSVLRSDPETVSIIPALTPRESRNPFRKLVEGRYNPLRKLIKGSRKWRSMYTEEQAKETRPRSSVTPGSLSQVVEQETARNTQLNTPHIGEEVPEAVAQPTRRNLDVADELGEPDGLSPEGKEWHKSGLAHLKAAAQISTDGMKQRRSESSNKDPVDEYLRSASNANWVPPSTPRASSTNSQGRTRFSTATNTTTESRPSVSDAGPLTPATTNTSDRRPQSAHIRQGSHDSAPVRHSQSQTFQKRDPSITFNTQPTFPSNPSPKQ